MKSTPIIQLTRVTSYLVGFTEINGTRLLDVSDYHMTGLPRNHYVYNKLYSFFLFV